MKLFRVGSISLFSWRRSPLKIGTILTVFLLAIDILSLRAQSDQTVPENPNWGIPPSSSGLPDEQDSQTQQTPPPLYPPLDVKTLPPAPIDPPNSALQIGLPQGNWQLPNLAANDSWFALDGLRARVGLVQLRFGFGMSFGYNDNIYGSNFPRVADYITSVSPTVEAGLGDFPRRHALLPLDEKENYFFLRYTPSPQFFAMNPQENTVNEDLQVDGRYSFSRLMLESTFTYTKNTNPTPSDLGRQEYRNYGLNITANYALSPKIFFQLGLNGFFQDYSQGVSYTTISIAPALGYQAGEKLQLTLGPVAGITLVEDGGRQPFQGVQLGFQYAARQKLTFTGSIGVQATQIQGFSTTGDTSFVNPVYSLGAIYLLSETSQIGLNLGESVSNSGSDGQAYVNTTVTLSFQKIFYRRVQLNLSGSYQSLAYQGNTTDERTDTYLYFNASIGYRFWQERCNVYLQYTRSQRFSEFDLYNYDANFFGTGIDVEF